MTKINKETIDKVAKLAKIKINNSENERLGEELTKITNWMQMLNEVDTKNIEPLYNVHDSELELFPDKVNNTDKMEDVIKNSTTTLYNYFTTPKIIE